MAVIKRNISYSLVTSCFKIFSGILLLMVLARFISLANFGIFTYALAFATIWNLIVDFGFSIKSLTDLPKDKANTQEIIGIATWVKLITAFFGLFFLIAFVSIAHLTANEIKVLVYMCCAQTVFSFGTLYLNPFRVDNRYHIETFFIGADGIFALIICSVVAYLNHNVVDIALGYFLEKSFFMLMVIGKYNMDFGFKKVKLKMILKEFKLAWPYAAHYLLSGIYLNVDTLILKFYVSNSMIALYQAGMRIVLGSGIVLGIVNTVMLPQLAEMLFNNKKTFLPSAVLMNWAFILQGLIFALILFVFSSPLIFMAYGVKFVALNNVIWIFSVIIFLRYFGGMFGVYVTISGKQEVRAIATLMTVFFVVISDIFIIPHFGIIGAGIDLILAHIFLNTIYIIYTKIEFNRYFILLPSFKSLFKLKRRTVSEQVV